MQNPGYCNLFTGTGQVQKKSVMASVSVHWTIMGLQIVVKKRNCKN